MTKHGLPENLGALSVFKKKEKNPQWKDILKY
jgi:hypothetical protein